MLKLLSISNLAVVDSLQLEFTHGLNILSGETGSGKSIVIDALGILSGNRVSVEVIRTGAERAYVEAVFDVAGNLPLLAALTDAGISIDDDEIVIKREISANGRGRIFINNQSATISLLKIIQPHVIDIHGQGDQQSLLSTDHQMKIYDTYLGAGELRSQVERLYENLLSQINTYENGQRSEAQRLQAIDALEYQINEIRRANIAKNEDVSLEQERSILANAERLTLLCDSIYRIIYDDELSVLSLIGQAQRKLEDIAEIDNTLSSHSEGLSNAKYILEDLAFGVREYLESIEKAPDKLQQVTDRIVEIGRLKRKYGGSIETVLEVLAEAEQRLDEIKQYEENASALVAKIRSLIVSLDIEAKKLSKIRLSNSLQFEQLMLNELRKVALERARFKLNFPPYQDVALPIDIDGDVAPSTAGYGKFGQESVEFLFSANPGEALRRLSDVASGGELSRLMLVLKTITAPTAFPRTLIFDEIDTGIGGRVADAVGLRLKRLAKTNQVLCVTHQAQIARYAEAHFLVTKQVDAERTRTEVNLLDQSGRVEELARMLAGKEITTTAKKHARELLKFN